jgi:hypothetical protein
MELVVCVDASIIVDFASINAGDQLCVASITIFA